MPPVQSLIFSGPPPRQKPPFEFDEPLDRMLRAFFDRLMYSVPQHRRDSYNELLLQELAGE